MTTFLKLKGGYRSLYAYQKAEVIYDITFYFTQHFLTNCECSRHAKEGSQMLQAARSGKQNIAEGSKASTTSVETEIKLTNVAKASLEELLIDYEDYLRVRNKEQWHIGHPRYDKVRTFASSKEIFELYPSLLPKYDDASLANLCITLINQTTFLLRRLIEKQQEVFLQKGGVREQMSVARRRILTNHNNNEN